MRPNRMFRSWADVWAACLVAAILGGTPVVFAAPNPDATAFSDDDLEPPGGLTRATRILGPSSTPAPPANDTGPVSPPAFQALPDLSGTPKSIGPAIRVTTLDGQTSRLAGVAPMEMAFEVVSLNQKPDLIWDPSTKEILANGDIIATGIDVGDIPSVVDRTATLRAIRAIAGQSPLPARLLPEAKVHKRPTPVELLVDDVGGKALLLINVAGDGTVQVLYPSLASDSAIYDKPQLKMQFAVREPYGADLLIAITSPARNIELEQALKRLDNQRKSGQIQYILTKFGLAGMRYGSVVLFTAP